MRLLQLMLEELKMLELKDIPEEVFPDNTILSGYRGSVAHGMADLRPESIDDIAGFPALRETPPECGEITGLFLYLCCWAVILC